MKLIIAGSRTIPEHVAALSIRNFLKHPPSSLPAPLEIISGGAKGVDTAAASIARELELTFIEFLPDWDQFGKSAGPRRNRLMADYGDSLLLIWDGTSKGSASMKSEMIRLRKPIWEIIVK